MNKFKSFINRFVFGEEDKDNTTNGYIKAVSPGGKVEVTVRFDDKSDFDSMKGDVVSLITNSFSEGV